jgi:hypothetical protein
VGRRALALSLGCRSPVCPETQNLHQLALPIGSRLLKPSPSAGSCNIWNGCKGLQSAERQQQTQRSHNSLACQCPSGFTVMDLDCDELSIIMCHSGLAMPPITFLWTSLKTTTSQRNIGYLVKDPCTGMLIQQMSTCCQAQP